MQSRHVKLIIIGSGPAGYTAAIYAARALLEPVLLTGIEQGGQLTITTEVENYPGYADPVQGPWIMEQMLAQATNVGAEIVNDHVSEVETTTRPFRVICDSGNSFTCDALVIATGAKAKWLGLESEQKFMGFGVSACATCDGFFYRGKHVLVVGGGNTAAEEALYLANLASKVTLIHRRDQLRADKVLQKRVFDTPNIEILWNTEIVEFAGETGLMPSLTGVSLRDKVSGATTAMAVDGVFIAIGHTPSVELFEGKLKQKPNGYLWTAPDSTVTDVQGIFAAGDVTDDIYRQAVTAAGLGCMAALEAEKFLAHSALVGAAAA